MNKTILMLSLVTMVGLSSAVSADEDASEETQTDTSQADQAQHKEGKRHAKRHHKRERMQKYMLKRVDANGDGKIDLSEYLVNAEQRFNNLDIDGDGYVTAEERKEAGTLMREKHREMKKKMRDENRAAQAEADGANN